MVSLVAPWLTETLPCNSSGAAEPAAARQLVERGSVGKCWRLQEAEGSSGAEEVRNEAVVDVEEHSQHWVSVAGGY